MLKIIVGSLLISGCVSTKKDISSFTMMNIKNIIVYKTKREYANNVPIQYSAKTKSVVSYPAPTDVERFKALDPIKLSNGYLLDRIGLSPGSVFLEFTFDEYSKFKEAPSLETMTEKIIDYAPFDELYNLGQPNDTNNSIEKLNKLIESGEIREFRVI